MICQKVHAGSDLLSGDVTNINARSRPEKRTRTDIKGSWVPMIANCNTARPDAGWIPQSLPSEMAVEVTRREEVMDDANVGTYRCFRDGLNTSRALWCELSQPVPFARIMP
jgi:hypothetical protein